ncbi:MAG: LapA family protein [Cyanobacteriota bacterium]|jgi:putative membrane protein
MGLLTRFFAAWLLASLFSAVAILATQNVTAVSLRFLMFASIQMPVGVLLSFALGGGFIVGSLLPVFFRPRRRRSPALEEDVDF